MRKPKGKLLYMPAPTQPAKRLCKCGRRRTALDQCPDCYRDMWRRMREAHEPIVGTNGGI